MCEHRLDERDYIYDFSSIDLLRPWNEAPNPFLDPNTNVDSSWNVMARGELREGKWRGNWRMQWVASTLHTTSEHGVPSITTADAHTSAASSRLNWRPRAGLNGLVLFARKTKSGFSACAITFQLASTNGIMLHLLFFVCEKGVATLIQTSKTLPERGEGHFKINSAGT